VPQRSPGLSALSALLVAVVFLTAGCTSHRAEPHAAAGREAAVRATPSAAPKPSGPVNPFASRVPTFGPPPAAEPIKLAGGPTAPIYKRLPVTQPVAFLTMDDGQTRVPQAAQLMQAAHIPFTMFLIAPVAAEDPPYFKKLTTAGGVIEDHTLTHPSMRGTSYAFQRHQICGAKTSLKKTFGPLAKPRFFRPPYGNYDQNTLRAVHDCGLQAAFYWSETVNEGIVRYQTPTHKIQRGDIILMHFRPAFIKDVIAALKAIHKAGLTPALLEDYFPTLTGVPTARGARITLSDDARPSGRSTGQTVTGSRWSAAGSSGSR
jgi:peptidoglycan/xylan/chitin deacetylase (PgdA/CDA1 family)